MKKGVNIVILGVLTVASIILALPFTPMRNSFKGVTANAADKVILKMGVDLDKKIKNARFIAKSHQYNVIDFNIVDMETRSKTNTDPSYSGMNGMLNDGTYGALTLTKEGKVSGIGGGGGALAFGGSRNTTNGGGGGDFVAISSKLTSADGTPVSNPTKQNGNSQNNGTGGGTHPGVDPVDIPPTLPVGNGVIYLLFLALGYTLYKNMTFRF